MFQSPILCCQCRHRLGQVVHKVMPTKWTRSDRRRPMRISLSQISFRRDQKARAKERTRSASRYHQVLRECIPEHPKGIRSVTATILGRASKDRRAHASMFVRCLGATRTILRRSINDHMLKMFHPTPQRNGRSNPWIMNMPKNRRM